VANMRGAGEQERRPAVRLIVIQNRQAALNSKSSCGVLRRKRSGNIRRFASPAGDSGAQPSIGLESVNRLAKHDPIDPSTRPRTPWARRTRGLTKRAPPSNQTSSALRRQDLRSNALG
jgi:hypothetical protein